MPRKPKKVEPTYDRDDALAHLFAGKRPPFVAIDPAIPITTVEATLRYMLVNYPSIFPTRGEALEHLFLVNGNGYDWINGCLVAYDDRDLTLTPAMWEEVRSYNHVARLHNAWAQARIAHDLKYEGKSYYSDHRMESVGPDDEAELAVLMRDMSRITEYVYPLNDYADINQVPDNVQSDWLAAAWQTIDMVLALDPTKGYTQYGWDHDKKERTEHYLPNTNSIAFVQTVVADLTARGLTRPEA